MTGPELFGALFLVMAAIGWALAIRDRREQSHEIDLPSAYQLRAWEKQRIVRAEGNRRLS